MRRVVVTLFVAAIAAVGALAGAAVASGPAPPGKQLVELNCTGLGPITVQVQLAPAEAQLATVWGQCHERGLVLDGDATQTVDQRADTSRVDQGRGGPPRP